MPTIQMPLRAMDFTSVNRHIEVIDTSSRNFALRLCRFLRPPQTDRQCDLQFLARRLEKPGLLIDGVNDHFVADLRGGESPPAAGVEQHAPRRRGTERGLTDRVQPSARLVDAKA